MIGDLTAADVLTPATGVASCLTSATLAAALAQVRSTHDPVFVMDLRGTLRGLISPHIAVYQKRFPPTTRVRHCLVAAPTITKTTPLPRVAQFMLDTRLYTLPVVERDKEVLGAVAAPVILRMIVKNAADLREVAARMDIRRAATLPLQATVRDAFTLFRATGGTRVLLTNERGRVRGLLTRQDIHRALARHRKYERFAARVGRAGRNVLRVEEEPPDPAIPAIEFSTKRVVMGRTRETMGTLLKRMVEQRVPSLVIVDAKNRPAGIISTRSVLAALARIRPTRRIPVLLHHRVGGPTGSYRAEKLTAILERFGTKIARRAPVQRIELSIDQPKNPQGKTVAFRVTLRARLLSGAVYIARSATHFVSRARHEGLETSVRDAMREIESQARRDHDRRGGKEARRP